VSAAEVAKEQNFQEYCRSKSAEIFNSFGMFDAATKILEGIFFIIS